MSERQDLLDSLIEHFSLDEGAGGVLTGDYGGVTLESSAITWANGIIGEHSTQSLEYPDTRNSDRTFANFHGKTFWGSVWVRPDSSRNGHICGRWGGSVTSQWQWALWGKGGTLTTVGNPDGRLLLAIADESNNDQIACETGNDAITAGSEHHVVFAYRPSDGYARIWVDGVLKAENTLGATTLYDIGTNSSQVFSIHNRAQWGTGGNYNWDASIDHLALGESLDIEQDHVDWLYNEGEGRLYNEYLTQPPTEEEVFEASFEDASGRDPFPSALLQRTPARKLANHYVSIYKYPPYLVTKRVPIALEDYALTKPGKMIWHKDANSALFSMGRWAQIQGRRFTDNPVEIELTLRISDHPESFEEPT